MGKRREAQRPAESIGSLIEGARTLRRTYQADPQRPRYHFLAPEGICYPFDPNGVLYWRGKYHLFYIYQDPALPYGGHCWGHASSVDLLHWTYHPTALAPGPGDPELGIFSGDAFLNKDGIPTLIYHGVGAGTCIATSVEDDLVHWTKHPANPIIPIPKEGDPGFGTYNVFDPCAWIEGDKTYAALGGQALPEGRYDTLYLFSSPDLARWEYQGQLYEPNPEWTDPEEDCACPDFFPLGQEHMLLFISHYAGTQYYLGRYEQGRFHPQRHGRMNWPGGPCFAPESLLDGQGRRIFWAWVPESRTREAQLAAGWSGVMSLPRVLSLADDGTLCIEPIEELSRLRLNHRRHENLPLAPEAELSLDDVRGDGLELALDVDVGPGAQFGLKVRCSLDGAEETLICCDPASGSLQVDTRRSSTSETVFQPWPQPFAAFRSERVKGKQDQRVQSAPFTLAPGEALRLRVYLDRSMLEVFANGRQCLTQRIYPARGDSLGVRLSSRKGEVLVRQLEAWDMVATNPW